ECAAGGYETGLPDRGRRLDRALFRLVRQERPHGPPPVLRGISVALRHRTGHADPCWNARPSFRRQRHGREGIIENVYYRWSKEFLEAGKKRLARFIRSTSNADRYLL